MIKRGIKAVVIALLKWEAILILKKYKPKIVAVTGTVGKTSVKDAVATILESKFTVRKSEKSYNSDFGVPLTILGAESGWNNPIKWILILLEGLRLIVARGEYPKWLVLEMGVDRPGDMDRLVSWIKPDVATVVMLGETPVHVEFFKDTTEVVREKIKLARAVDPSGYVVLNGDDEKIAFYAESIKANVLTFGFSEGNDLVASNYAIAYKEEDGKKIPEGVSFKVDYGGKIVPVRLAGVFGKQFVYNALSALGMSVALGLNLVEAAETLSFFESPPGRLKLLEGIKNSYIIDDTYNSSPIASEAALEVLKDLPAARRIAVLGDMLELGKHTIDEHKKLGDLICENEINLLFTVGPRSKFIAEEARERGFDDKNIFEFSIADEVRIPLQNKMGPGDLVLIKGSQSMRMEKIVEEIMAHPEDKEKLLVRQDKEWQNR